MPAGKGYVTVDDGLRLYFECIGDGERALFVPNGFHLLEDFRRLARGRTSIFYDLRNRGLSDAVTDPQKLANGVHNDVEDLDAVRRHFGLERISLIGHSYVGLTVMLYARKFPEHVDRIVQIGPLPPNAGMKYPPHLAFADSVLEEVFSELGELQKQRESLDPVEFCQKFWAVLRSIYVADPACATRIDWGRCELPNERGFMKYWNQHIYPSIKNLDLSAQGFAKMQRPVLTIHGVKDRSAAYGGGRDWAAMLPSGRLLSVENAGHAPWIEAPETVFDAIEMFLGGTWPSGAETIPSAFA